MGLTRKCKDLWYKKKWNTEFRQKKRRMKVSEDCKTELIHPGQTCAGVQVPSQAEVTALNEMRRIKERARSLKKHISELKNNAEGFSHGQLEELEGKLAMLKEAWKDWEEKRKQGAHERMVLLGHKDE
jgi:hypothetical protein